MKREELKELGLNEDQINAIMKANGEDIEKAKGDLNSKTAELEKIKAEKDASSKALQDTEAKLKELQAKGVNVEELEKELKKVKDDFNKQSKEIERKETERIFNDKIDSLIKENGGLNAKAIRSLLNVEELAKSQNQDTDIKSAIVVLKNADDSKMLFQSKEPINNPIAPTGKQGANPEPKGSLLDAIKEHYNK